jgi:hypothetical protein
MPEEALLRRLGIDPSFRPEGVTRKFKRRAQRESGGRRWPWRLEALSAQYHVRTWRITLN